MSHNSSHMHFLFLGFLRRTHNTCSIALIEMTFRAIRHNCMANKDAMGCSVAGTHDVLSTEKTCRTVKEFANILSIGHHKLACLNAGYSEEHCMSDFSCCLTY